MVDEEAKKKIREAFYSKCRIPWTDESLENYYALKDASEKYYRCFTPVKCPALNNSIVNFTSEGFNHLVYKNKIERGKKDQYIRFKFIEKARDLIIRTTTSQEYDERLQEVLVKHKKKKSRETKLIKYWAFISVLDRLKIKVIVKQAGNGNYMFWSVIPFWRVEKYGNLKFKSFSKTDLEDE